MLPSGSRIFSDEAETIIYRENTHWEYVLEDLGKRNIHSVLVEGGATLLNNIIASGIYDEVHIEVSDKEIGKNQKGVKAPLYECRTSPRIIDGHRVYVEKNL